MIPYTGEFVQIFLSVLKSGGRGYEISYATSKNNVKKVKTTSLKKNISVTKGKTYSVRVRSYKKIIAKNSRSGERSGCFFMQITIDLDVPIRVSTFLKALGFPALDRSGEPVVFCRIFPSALKPLLPESD